MAEGSERKNVYISLHEAFVREGIQYTDRSTGEQRSFNVVRLPPDTVIGGRDVGGYEFSPLYVNPSRFRGEHWRDVPLLADREVRLSRSVHRRRGPAGPRRGRQTREGDARRLARPDQGGPDGGAEEVLRGARAGRQGPVRARRGGEGRGGEHGEGRPRAPFRP